MGKLPTNFNSPCYNCEERRELCHSDCEKYIAFQKERQSYIEKRKTSRESDRIIMDYINERNRI